MKWLPSTLKTHFQEVPADSSPVILVLALKGDGEPALNISQQKYYIRTFINNLSSLWGVHQEKLPRERIVARQSSRGMP